MKACVGSNILLSPLGENQASSGPLVRNIYLPISVDCPSKLFAKRVSFSVHRAETFHWGRSGAGSSEQWFRPQPAEGGIA